MADKRRFRLSILELGDVPKLAQATQLDVTGVVAISEVRPNEWVLSLRGVGRDQLAMAIAMLIDRAHELDADVVSKAMAYLKCANVQERFRIDYSDRNAP